MVSVIKGISYHSHLHLSVIYLDHFKLNSYSALK